MYILLEAHLRAGDTALARAVVVDRASVERRGQRSESFGALLELALVQYSIDAEIVEVIDDGRTGFLCDQDDIGAMAARGVELLTDKALHERIAAAGEIVVNCVSPPIDAMPYTGIGTRMH